MSTRENIRLIARAPFHRIVLKCKSFGATLKVDPHLFVFNGIIKPF